jgi:hypothetical protein
MVGISMIEMAPKSSTPPPPRNAARPSTPATDIEAVGRPPRQRAADGESWAIHLAAEGPGPALPIRIRRFLKAALRRFGLRCTSIGGCQTVETDTRTPGQPDFLDSEQSEICEAGSDCASFCAAPNDKPRYCIGNAACSTPMLIRRPAPLGGVDGANASRKRRMSVATEGQKISEVFL